MVPRLLNKGKKITFCGPRFWSDRSQTLVGAHLLCFLLWSGTRPYALNPLEGMRWTFRIVLWDPTQLKQCLCLVWFNAGTFKRTTEQHNFVKWLHASTNFCSTAAYWECSCFSLVPRWINILIGLTSAYVTAVIRQHASFTFVNSCVWTGCTSFKRKCFGGWYSF